MFQEKAAEEVRPDSSASVGGKGDSKLTNQFNFSERASQTYNNPYRVSYKLIINCIKNSGKHEAKCPSVSVCTENLISTSQGTCFHPGPVCCFIVIIIFN